MTRLFVVRHGDTFMPGESPRRIGACTDLPLTTNGEEQGRALGRAFAPLRFAAAWSGPLVRARRTAELVLAASAEAPPLSIVPALNEIDHGPDEGQPEDAVRRRLGPAALQRWEAEAVAPADWRVEAEARLAWWRDLLAAPPVGDTLLVTSNGAARFAVLALGHDLPPSLKLRTGAFGVLHRSPDGDWRIERWDVRPSEVDPPPPVRLPG